MTPNFEPPPLIVSTDGFPELRCPAGPVNLQGSVEKGTGGAFAGGVVLAMLGILVGGLLTYGILWLILLLSPLIDYFNRKRSMALLRGSSLEVGPNQFPELHACALDFAQRTGLNTPPDIYILESNTINAAAARIGSRKVIILIDDVVDACLRSGEPKTLSFILAHEMAHHALGHTGIIRSAIARASKKLSRLDEFSCDAVADQLVGDRRISFQALSVLLSGPQLFRFINRPQLLIQAQQVAADKTSAKAERKLSHPLLLRRLQRFIA